MPFGLFSSEPKFDRPKLKNQLRMALTRLQMLINKKRNLGQRLKNEIAGLLRNDKIETARVRVESLMADDDWIDGMEMAMLFVELVTTRVDLLVDASRCPPELKEPVTTLIWVSARLDHVPELTEIRKQVGLRFGKGFLDMALGNTELSVSPDVMHRLSVKVPDNDMCVTYLKTIAAEHDIPLDAEALARAAPPGTANGGMPCGAVGGGINGASAGDGGYNDDVIEDEIDARLQCLKRQ